MYTEEELSVMTRSQLMEICKKIAIRYTCPLENIVPYGARKEILVEAILESQEEAGGSND